MVDKAYPSLLEPSELAERLDDPTVRIIDATLFARLGANAAPIIESGLDHWRAGRIPGAHYVHPIAQASDTSAELPAMAPKPEQFEALTDHLGINKNNHIIIYSAENPWWATRLWWVFHIYEYENVSVLNGGYANWLKEGRPVSVEAPTYDSSSSAGQHQPQLIAGRDDVLAAVSDPDTILINALEPGVFSGEDNPGYGRDGHITGSVNVPSSKMFEAETSRYIALDKMEQLLALFVPDKTTDVICYCGSGIAASIVVFCLHLCGYKNVQLYDAGLREWVSDPNLPMTCVSPRIKSS